MLQPRSFLFTRSSSPSAKLRETKYERLEVDRRTKSPGRQDYKDMPSTRVSNAESRPTTPSSPVVIPRGHHDTAHERKRPQGGKERRHGRGQSEKGDRRTRNIHSPDALPPSVAALLAITAIPPQKNHTIRSRSGSRQKLTVDTILQHTNVSEKEFGLSLGKSPLDFLLSPPDDEEETTGSDNGHESVLSTRTMSMESVPSLDNSSIDDSSPSLDSLATPGTTPMSRSRRARPVHSLLHRESSEDHPLAGSEFDIDELDFGTFHKTQHEEVDVKAEEKTPSPSRKFAFKSNLTASLRALRSVGKTFSSLAAPMITPDEFLTRSIISIDPQVPFTDERMPPRLEDTPTPALRRYLNPTTNAPIEAHVPSSLAQTMPALTCTASIQMQTYKVSRSSRSSSPNVISRRTQSGPASTVALAADSGPLARQRDMRENSDFIRVAVMEMLMRKKGKLDDQRPGRARWALPPRKPPTKPYEIAENGVPVRWIAITQT